jgi:hypothetical protein
MRRRRGCVRRRRGEGGTLPHAVAPVGAPSVYLRGGAEKSKGFDGDAAACGGVE